MIGRRIAHYEILDHLGQGGMGVVYRAQDAHLDRIVALKFLPRDLTRDPVARSRFVHEAKAASALDHGNICTIYDIGETDDDQMYIAMAYYEGTTLRDMIAGGALSVEQTLAIGRQIADGLAKAHQAGIVHRDIKPDNIMVTTDGQAKIVDFGLAKVAEQTQITQEGSAIGTVAYMSPEQARGESIDSRTDQWALGAVLYEMLTGRRAFAGDYPQAVIYSILNEEPVSIAELNPTLSKEVVQLVERTMTKNPGERFPSTGELAVELERLLYLERGLIVGSSGLHPVGRFVRSPRLVLSAMLVVAVVVTGFVWFLKRQAEVRYARNELFPRIDELMESSWSDYTVVYELAEELESILPDDPRVAEIFAKSSFLIDVATEPPGADVYLKPYAKPDGSWRYLGRTPMAGVRVPVGIFRWKVEKEGYETVLAAATTWYTDVAGKQDSLIVGQDFFRTLDREGSVPKGMVRVPGVLFPDGSRLGDFFIDRTEITNRQYREFIDAGGYVNREFWKHEFVKDGAVLRWEEAMSEFVDLTGRPGPATWQAGIYLEGQEGHPVRGVSWYEAAAFAEWAGKELPTEKHWGRARGDMTPLIQVPQLGGFGTFAPFSNLASTGTVPVASLPGYTSFGAYDMSGNVREWCWNETPKGRLIRGGAWSDNSYYFSNLSQAPAFDRSETNGFRLAYYPDRDQLSEALFGLSAMRPARDFRSVEPVSDDVFAVFREQFFYDVGRPLGVQVESVDQDSRGWTYQRVTYNAAYGDERIITHIFLPGEISPPYQAVVYFPGVGARSRMSSQRMDEYYEFTVFLSFLVRSGRAVVFPVYKGTFERKDPTHAYLFRGLDLYSYSEYVIQLVKDFRRTVDYLETRQDIDSSRLAFYGMSWGAKVGPLITAVEGRIKASILLAGGLTGRGRPEVQDVNYVPRVTVPTLILGGEYDSFHPAETSQEPMFNLLGTPAEHKALKLYPTDHIPPMNEVIRETLAWLDSYLGSVTR